MNACIVGFHKWDGCKCQQCGKDRDKGHDWSKDCEKCSLCGKARNNGHNWNGYICDKCGIVQEDRLKTDFERGITLREAKRLEESRQLLQVVVEARTHEQGREGFDSQCAISQLGRTLCAMGNYKDAAALHLEVLNIRIKLYGSTDQLTENSIAIFNETLNQWSGEVNWSI